MDPSDGLRLLADWFDGRTPNDPNPEVQRDLRQWADDLEQAQARVDVLEFALGNLVYYLVGTPDQTVVPDGWVKKAEAALAEGDADADPD